MTKYTITEEQIQEICQKVSDVMLKETSAENCTFPTSQIIQGIKEELSPEEISNKCYDSIIGAPAYTSAYFALSARMTLHNMALYMSGLAKKELEAYVTPEESED